MFKALTTIILLIVSLHGGRSLVSIKEEKAFQLPGIEANKVSPLDREIKPFDFFSNSFVSSLTDIAENSSGSEEKEKVGAYNVKSEKAVGNIPQVAIDNSPALVPCSSLPDGCEEELLPSPTNIPPTPSIQPIPTSTPSPTPFITIIPEPTIYPCPPPPCPYNKDSRFIPEMPCPMYPEVYPCAYLDQIL